MPVRLATRRPRERETMRAMHDAVENRVGERGIAQVLVPAVDRQLTGDDRRAVAIPVIEDLEQVLALRAFERDEAPIIEDQHVDACEAASTVGYVPSPCASVSSGNRRGMRR
jgi:hypothetical protein